MFLPQSYNYIQRPRHSDHESRQEVRTSHRRAEESPKVQHGHTKPVVTGSAQSAGSFDIAPSAMLSKPVTIPSRRTQRLSNPVISSGRHEEQVSARSKRTESLQSTDALSPSIAALLAVTSIPRPRAHQARKRKESHRRISIDELVQEWRDEARLRPTIGSHKSMDILLDSTDQPEENRMLSDGEATPTYDSMCSRSTSSDSVPSLDLDDHSILSVGDPPTPEALRSERSSSFNAKRGSPRSLPISIDADGDHPLGHFSESDNVFAEVRHSQSQSMTPSRPKSSLKSNLTTSLQSLKSRAISSLQSLNLNTVSSSHQAPSSSNTFSDAALWQHPYLFPRFSSEIRPSPFTGTPSSSDRRYFNPTPLNFEDQQSHYRQALHASLILDHDESATPMIMMQTYSREKPARSRRSSRHGSKSRHAPDPATEAGRAMAGGPPLVRQREPRENPDFLRVVVLEMNMRREGKLEETMGGRARIWLPARKTGSRKAAAEAEAGNRGAQKHRGRRRDVHIPRRWVSICADEM